LNCTPKPCFLRIEVDRTEPTLDTQGISVDETGRQHFLDATVAYKVRVMRQAHPRTIWHADRIWCPVYAESQTLHLKVRNLGASKNTKKLDLPFDLDLAHELAR
jgi:hypothetical protein